MKYYLIVGEASGDLHASNLMCALIQEDPEAEFRFFGGDLMTAVGGTRVKHYKELAYMGFIPVLLHLRTIFRNMKECKQDIVRWAPDVVILVDYPGFNLKIAEFITLLKTLEEPPEHVMFILPSQEILIVNDAKAIFPAFITGSVTSNTRSPLGRHPLSLEMISSNGKLSSSSLTSIHSFTPLKPSESGNGNVANGCGRRAGDCC